MTSPIGTGNNTAGGVVSSLGSGKAMGKEDFLRLLVAQLENQDPLNPSDPTEFTAQLAQFSSLEQLFGVNETLERVAAANSGLERLSALSLIGREVVAVGETFRFGEGGVDLGYRLQEPATEVKLLVQDDDGRTVTVLAGGEHSPGEHILHWDGADGSGKTVAPGEYRLVVSALTETGTAAAVPLIKGVVKGVDFDGVESRLVTTSGDFRLLQVAGIREFQP